MNDAKRFEILSNIMRASHFEWRRAILKQFPDQDPVEMVKKYWEEVGKDTAGFYVRKIDPSGDIPRQVAALIVSSSVAMGEDAVLAENSDGCATVLHRDCPWYHWHKREGILEEDLAGCDHWLRTVINEINKTLGVNLRFETTESLPGGGKRCVRRIWEEI